MRRYKLFTVGLVFGVILIALYLTMTFYRVYTAPAPIDYTPAYLHSESQHIGARLTDAGYWQTSEYHGRYYNINADGERRVLGQPIRHTHTLWLFGNSGTYDPFVPDSAAMTTDLQLLLDRNGYSMRVVNRSAGGQHISGELAWLRLTPVAHGDVVMFIDGAMDQSTPKRNDELIAAARTYSERIGATFYHFTQPSDTPLMVQSDLFIPSAGFVESVHLNAYGDLLLAHMLYQALTEF